MDWSSVYENSGEEDGNWENHGETRSSRNAHRLLHCHTSLHLTKQQNASAQYSPYVAYAFTVNYILGVGSLGIPYAFYRAGLIMSNIMIVLVTLLSYMTVMWVCESVARAREAFVLTFRLDETSALRSFTYSSRQASVAVEYEDFPEVTQLCDRFLGPVGSKMYQISLLGLMYGGLVGYSQVFVNTFLTQVDHIGDWQLSSVHAAIVFACIVLPLSCSDLTEQIYVQLAMSVVRFAALLIMVISAAYAVYGDPYDGGARLKENSESPYISDYSLVDMSGFGVMFSTSVFSQLFQHSVPGLLAPLGARNQEKAKAIFGSTLLTTMMFYIALGSVSSLYFGPKLATSVNLNWADFTWGVDESITLVPLWAKLLSMIVVVFPALDTLSVFPLICVTLGDNMAVVVPKRWGTRRGKKSSWKLLCRLGAALPPLLISMFVSDLSVTLQISGLMGIYVAFFAPALLQLQARREIPNSNVYSGIFSGTAYLVLQIIE
ncbi:unnamed protein product [Peronospora destructor]|uniref:Amino acid transporter transmembrane domain-containing protein n=1 Tax=Peronospora destructor TaxID=86335 RepID=A0AAV0TZ45_9STRA|nr:unnamed protein product [Peronospora destructor]